MRGNHGTIIALLLSLCTKHITSFSLLTPKQLKQHQTASSLMTKHQQQRRNHQKNTIVSSSNSNEQTQQIISPFDNSAALSDNDNGSSVATTTTTTTTTSSSHEILDLTYENVELVLDSMRHFLIQDGGNVIIDEIDGPIVKLQLQGNCGTCPSSTQTMKMGLERGLKERIPEIQEVIQSLPEGPPLVSDQIEIVLDGVRPFLQIVGGTIVLDRIEGLDSIQPSIILQMSGSSASLNSVKLEIAQRLQRHFMMSGLQIHWKEE